METMMNFEAVRRMPETLCADVRNAAATMSLTYKICKEMADGVTMEEVLKKHLPATVVEKNMWAAQQITDGVNSVYDGMDDDVDQKWMENHLNAALDKLTNEERFTYLSNCLTLIDSEELDDEEWESIRKMETSDTVTDEDIDIMIELVMNSIDNNAGIMKRSSVKVMEKNMHKIPKTVVTELSSASKDTSMAYAAASYIMQQQKMGKDDSVEANHPYVLGVTSAANIEGNRYMAMYYRGKMTLASLHEKLERMYKAAITFASSYIIRGLAVGSQLIVTFGMSEVIYKFLFHSLHFGAPMAAVGALALAIIAGTVVLTTNDYEDALNQMWSFVKAVWEGCKNLLGRLFLHETSDRQEEEQDVVNTDTEDAENVEEEEYDEEDEEDDEDDDEDESDVI